MNSSSEFTISSDWDVIDEEMAPLDSHGKMSEEEEAASVDLKANENPPKGSCVDDVPEQEITDSQPEIIGEIKESEINNHSENGSSSEFDVLDEAVDDNQSSLSFSHMEYSISSSLANSSHPSLIPEDAEVEPDPIDDLPPNSRAYRDHQLNIHPYLLSVVIALIVISVLIVSLPFGTMQKMKERIGALQTENEELKNLVQSKLENDKLLMALEEQIKSLKDENYKLSESMKSLVAQLEEQTAILKQDKETKEQDPYRSEIERLKEQINILQIDNEELQKQLVRTRYGIYSPHQDSKTGEKEHAADKPDGKENRENSSEILVEEINELRKKLYIEVEKLKTWKDSVQHLVKKLGNEQAGSPSEDGEKQSFEGSSEKEEEKKPKRPGQKDKKISDWSWRGMKKNLRDTIEGLQDIDVHNMFSNYVDKKKIEGVFDSVGHYFKKAQEKTKKALNMNSDFNHEMWNFFGQVRDQLNVLNKKFNPKYFSKQAPTETDDRKSPFPKSKHESFENENKFDKYQKHKKPKVKYDHNMPLNAESFATSPTAESQESEKAKMAPEKKESNDGNSWVFRRAAHRSQLREEEQEAFTNWFLKRGRDFHYNEDESLKEWIRETYQNGNSDED